MNITPTAAIRVWTGYKLASMPNKDFYRILGDTFIPGTMLMLQPLGINAYNVASLVHENSALPNECALIVYKSQAAYRAITRENLQGRVHRASHYAVFDMQKSRASFPLIWNEQIVTNETFYLFEKDVNWQSGSVVFSIVTFESLALIQSKLVTIINKLKSKFSDNGITQVLVTIKENLLIFWSYSETTLENTNEYSSMLDEVLVNTDFKINKTLLAKTLPCFNSNPELMYVENDMAVQFKFLVNNNSLIF